MDRRAAPRAERAELRPALTGCDADVAQSPVEEVLARIPWDGVRQDPERMTAEQFLGTLI